MSEKTDEDSWVLIANNHENNMASQDRIKPWKQPPPKTYIFKNANLVNPVNGSVQKNCSVCISDGFVEWIADGATSMNEKATTIDVEGNYLCPGLIDSHVHITAVPGSPDLKGVFEKPFAVSAFRQPYVCGQMLSRGFTTVRDCGGATLALKEAIADGVFPGPRLFIANHALSQTGGHGDQRGPHDQTSCCGGSVNSIGRICDGVGECIKGVREEIRTGADFIKIMCGGGVASPTDQIENIQFTAEEIQAITTVAGHAGKWVTTHAYTPEAIQHAIRNGVKGIEHGNFIDKETAKLMAEKDIFLTPTLITYSEMASPEWTGFLPPENIAKNETVLKAGLQSLKLASEAGVTLCYGTDLLGPLGTAQTKEFALRNQVLSPLALLQSATINPARMLRQEKALGQLRPGFVADMLILNKNPLEDIQIFDSPDSHLLAVIKGGRVYRSRWTKLPRDAPPSTPVIE